MGKARGAPGAVRAARRVRAGGPGKRTGGDIGTAPWANLTTPKHTTDDAVPTGRRAFTKKELQRLFDYLDDLVDREYAAGSKRWLPVFRDSIAFKVCYAYGLRRRELTMLGLHDFGPNPQVRDTACSAPSPFGGPRAPQAPGPRRRTVLTVPEFDWVVPILHAWTSRGRRDRFTTADRSAALWPSERLDRVTLGALGDSFAAARDAVGLPKELGLHCLRHCYVTHLIEARYDPTFVQAQVGHSYASTTSLYTSVSSDFRQKAVQQMIARRIGSPEDGTDG
jgi:integrase/recombinase XerD